MASSDLVIGLLIFLSDTYPYYKKTFFQKRSILDIHFSDAQKHILNNRQIAELVGSIDSKFLDNVGNHREEIIQSIYKFMISKLKK